MRKSISLLLIAAMLVSMAPQGVFAEDKSPSSDLGQAADEAGREFVANGTRVAEAFIVVGKTVIYGTTFVILKGAQGVIYVEEQVIIGLKHVVAGAKFVIIKTAEGIRWVAVNAIKLGEVVIDAVADAANLVIDGVVYTLIALEEGVAYVAHATVEVVREGAILVLHGVEYVATKTVDGIVWVTKKTLSAIKAGYEWTRDTLVIANMRQRLSLALAAGDVGESTLRYFQSIASNAKTSSRVRRLASSALAACQSFNQAWAANR